MILHFNGQLRGGKNNVIVTRSGHRFPNPIFAKWRDSMLWQIRAQTRAQGSPEPMALPVQMWVDYWHGDMLRRDMDALLGGIFHVLERAGVLEDDKLVKRLLWEPQGLDRKNPRATVRVEPLDVTT